MSDYFSDPMQSRPASAPPSSSSGFDLASRAFDFDTDDAGAYSDDGAGAYSDDAGAYPLTGDYDRGVEEGDHVDGFLLTGSDFLGVPGFDFNEFLDACGDAPYVNVRLLHLLLPLYTDMFALGRTWYRLYIYSVNL